MHVQLYHITTKWNRHKYVSVNQRAFHKMWFIEFCIIVGIVFCLDIHAHIVCLHAKPIHSYMCIKYGNAQWQSLCYSNAPSFAINFYIQPSLYCIEIWYSWKFNDLSENRILQIGWHMCVVVTHLRFMLIASTIACIHCANSTLVDELNPFNGMKCIIGSASNC